MIDTLVEILLFTGQDEAALIIDPNMVDMVYLSRCDPRKEYIENFSFGEANPKVQLKIDSGRSRDSKSNAYQMRGIPRGYFYLVNNYFTKGTYKEMQRFRNIFHQLNFEVIMRKNLSAKEILKDILLLSMNDELKNQSAFVFMSITHGNSNGEIFGFDGKTVKIENLIELFSDKYCPNMKRKPRAFFFNCCRGCEKLF